MLFSLAYLWVWVGGNHFGGFLEDVVISGEVVAVHLEGRLGVLCGVVWWWW